MKVILLKRVAYTTKQTLHFVYWLFRVAFVLFFLFFARLYYGPLDLTWIKGFLKSYPDTAMIQKLDLVMKGARLRLRAQIRVDDVADQKSLLWVQVSPDWWQVMQGRLRLNKITFILDEFDFSKIDTGNLSKENFLDGDKKNQDIAVLWSKFYRTIRAILDEIVRDGHTKITLKFPRVTLWKTGQEKHPMYMANVKLGAEIRAEKQDYLSIDVFLKNTVRIADKELFLEHPLEISSAKAKLILQKDNAELDFSEIGVAGVLFSGKVRMLATSDTISTVFTFQSDTNMNSSALLRIWPESAAKGGKSWVQENVKQAVFSAINVGGSFLLTPQYEIEKLEFAGSAALGQGVLSYFGELPQLQDLKAAIKFNLKGMQFHISQGGILGTVIERGEVDISGFDQPDQTLNIDLTLKGGVRDVLSIIDSKPLQYAQKVDLDPSQTTGSIAATMSFNFPLLKDLKFEDVALSVQGSLEDVAITKLPARLPYEISKGKGTLGVTQKNLLMVLDAQSEEQPVALRWESNFEKNVELDNQFIVQGHASLSVAKKLGVDLHEYIQSNVPMHFKLVYQDIQGKDDILTVYLDLKPVRASLPWIFFDKRSGDMAQFNGTFTFPQNSAMELKHFSVQGKNIDLKGAIDFHGDNTLMRIKIVNSSLKTDVIKQAQIDRVGISAWKVQVLAEKLDMTPYWNKYVWHKSLALGMDISEKVSLDLQMAADSVVINDSKKPLDSMQLKLSTDNNEMRDLYVVARYLKENETEVSYKVVPETKQGLLEVQATNVSHLLGLLNIAEKTVGGDLDLKARHEATGAWSGTATLKDFIVIKAPTMARVFSAAAITGLSDLLNKQKGLSFSSLSLEFTYHKDVLEFLKVIAASPSIAISTKGKIRLMPEKIISMKGTFTPFNMINGFVSYIPIVGRIFAGDEGEGIFSFTFSLNGPLEQPKVEVNPLSVLAPGFLRKIFAE